jgi:hypothetical protein
MLDIRALYGKTYRLKMDESASIPGQTAADRLWLQQIRCRYGHIYPHSVDTLGAYTDRRLIIGRLIAIPGVTLHQLGDSECSVIFDPAHLPQVAELLRAYKRRRLSPEKQTEGADRLRRWRERRAADHSPR